MGIMSKLGYTKVPKPPKPKVVEENNKQDEMVVDVTKKEQELKNELNKLKLELDQIKKKEKPLPEMKEETATEAKESDLDAIKQEVELFYQEYGIFNATASNETLTINLLYGILQELKKLNKK